MPRNSDETVMYVYGGQKADARSIWGPQSPKPKERFAIARSELLSESRLRLAWVQDGPRPFGRVSGCNPKP